MRGLLHKTGRLLPALLMATALVITGCSSSSSSSGSGSGGSDGGDGGAGTSIEQTAWPAMEALASMSATDIASVQYTRSTEGGIESGSIADATQIEDVYLRLKNVAASGKSDRGVDDDSLSIKLEASGTSLAFNFEGDILLLEDGSRYDVENLSSLKSYIDGLIEESAGAAGAAPDSSEHDGEAGASESAASPDASEGPSASPNPVGSNGYDVGENFSKTTNGDGSIEYLYFNDFMMIMPGNEKWSFDMNGDSVTFYLFSAQQEGYGGRLVTIRAFDLDDDSYEQLPSYHVAGIGNNVGKRFVAIYPTDVQWNGADSAQDADYRDLRDYLLKIGEGAVNSPLQTADSNPEA